MGTEIYLHCSKEARLSFCCGFGYLSFLYFFIYLVYFGIFWYLATLLLPGRMDEELKLMSNTETFFFFFFSFIPGAAARLAQPFLRPQFGSSHVCIPVVPHPFHCQVSTLHGLPHHWLTTLWGKKKKNLNEKSAPPLHQCFFLLYFVLLKSFTA